MASFKPKISTRAKYKFAELALAAGPQEIGVTGDNSYETLFGREWLLELRSNGTLHLYQENDNVDGEWQEVTANLPSFFTTPLPEDARRITFAFDQSARLIFAYEHQEIIHVTRWDIDLEEYKQNVSFPGVDPTVLMDATLADPSGFPDRFRHSAEAGIETSFEWLPDGQQRTNAIPDSDILLFYLTPDRQEVRCRVQRQVYSTEHIIWTGDTPLILDLAVAVGGSYQILLSDEGGEPVDALISENYIGAFQRAVPAITELDATTAFAALAYRHFRDIYTLLYDDPVFSDATFRSLIYTSSRLIVSSDQEDAVQSFGEMPLVSYIAARLTLTENPDPDAVDLLATLLPTQYNHFRVISVWTGDDAVVANGGMHAVYTEV